jgi:hypothetical protein
VRPFRQLLTTFALTLCFACTPQTYVIQQYEGPVRPEESIAILRINGAEPVRVVTLDGEYADPKLEPDTRLHIEVVPGSHELEIRTRDDDSSASDYRPRISRTVKFEAAAGRVYRVVLEPVQTSVAGATATRSEPKVFEVERGSDKKVRDVTVFVKPEAARAPRSSDWLPPYLAPPPIIAPPAKPSSEPEGASSAPPPDPSIPPMP